jgi:hypothetical protein
MKSTRRVVLDAGEIALTVHVDVLALSTRERRFLNTLIDQVEQFEALRATAAIAAHADTNDDGRPQTAN